MMKIFIDTNVILDVLQERTEFLQDSMSVLQMGMDRSIKLCATPLTFATCHYLLRKEIGKERATLSLQAIKDFIELTTMDDAQGTNALYSGAADFEDMLQYESAVANGSDIVITRNARHFPKEPIPVMTPAQFLFEYT